MLLPIGAGMPVCIAWEKSRRGADGLSFGPPATELPVPLPSTRLKDARPSGRWFLTARYPARDHLVFVTRCQSRQQGKSR